MKKIAIHTSNRRLVENIWISNGGTTEIVRGTGEVRFRHPRIAKPLRINGRRNDVPAKLLSNLNQVIRSKPQDGKEAHAQYLSIQERQNYLPENLGTPEMPERESEVSMSGELEKNVPRPTKFSYRVRQRRNGSRLAGKTISIEIPSFEWDVFKNTPNAQEFVRRAYMAEAKKQARIAAEKGGELTCPVICSMEEFLLAALRFTKSDIQEWLATRDWESPDYNIPERSRALLKKVLPMVVTEHGLDALHRQWSKEKRDKAYQYVADLADKPDDPVADFIGSKLTIELESEGISADDF